MSPPMNSPKTSPIAGGIARLTLAWQNCSVRERQLVAVAAAVVAVGIVLSLAEWTGRERVRLARALPRAQAQLELTQESATEIAGLKGRAAPQRATGAPLAEAVSVSAKSRGLAVTVQPSGDGLQIRGSGDFDELVTWLGALQNDQGLRVTRAEIQRAGPQASVDALLAGPAAP